MEEEEGVKCSFIGVNHIETLTRRRICRLCKADEHGQDVNMIFCRTVLVLYVLSLTRATKFLHKSYQMRYTGTTMGGIASDMISQAGINSGRVNTKIAK